MVPGWMVPDKNSSLSNRPNPFRNKGTYFKAPSGDGMHPAAFRSLSAEKEKTDRMTIGRFCCFIAPPILLAYSAAGFSFSKAPRRSLPARGRSAPTKRGRKSSDNPSCGWPRISSSPRKCGTRMRPSARRSSAAGNSRCRAERPS